MATLTLGFSASSADVTGASYADPALVRQITLTNGTKPYDATVSATANATTTLWTAANNGASATAASCDIAIIIVDPAQTETTSLPIDLILTYTTVSSTSTTTEAVYLVGKREFGPMVIPGEGRLSAGTQVFLTKIEAKNRNTGTSDAVSVRVQVWN